MRFKENGTTKVEGQDVLKVWELVEAKMILEIRATGGFRPQNWC